MSERPFLRVVRGTPEDEELAALTAVLAGLANTAAPEPVPAPRSGWGNREAALRRPLHPGPGAWRRS
ncbi:hypothetical protein JOF53_003521 [Crossiella equi]|uniref:Acyl-CoA carboxylase subunit epsilon n=1 Tax=Crossiella equi TaxID=130796 RepID=A0ABS5ADK5_9PSEU|nr:acyl-CoA carboxylase subunit epsilon [Crossiella equi]MBP2474649.1 hypothetical protein [Crossiella equi]